VTVHRTQIDGYVDAAQMRMLWTIAGTLAANAAVTGNDLASFQGYAISARRLSVGPNGHRMVRVVILQAEAAERALQGLHWDLEDEIESFVVTLPFVQRQACDDAVVEQPAGTDGNSLWPSESRRGQTPLSPPAPSEPNHSRWLSQPVRCTSRIAQTGVISRDPVAARPGGTCPFVNPPGDVHPRSGMGVPLHGHPRV
jgi:hypothetical protein